MLKMKLPLRTGEERGDDTAEEESLEPALHQRVPRLEPQDEPPPPPAPGAPGSPSRLDKESVFEWFGLHLNPARRIEFMCGLLHMCQPLELRFLGSYLEDLARKDYQILRDSECRANSASDLGLLTDVVDPVVRSKLLVYLSLLQSDNRECAGILFRILSRVDPAVFYKNYPLPPFRDPQHLSFHPPCPEGGLPDCGPEPASAALEQLALLFTMASLHPAFPFHQREVVRERLEKMELALAEERGAGRSPGQATELIGQTPEYLPAPSLGLGECPASHPPCQSRRSGRWAAQREAVHIEGIVLTHISRTRVDKEYKFEVKWSDSSSSSVTKTHLELENFLLKLPKDQCTESFEKSILRLLNQGDQYESLDVEKHLRERFLSAPPLFRKTRKVCSFFNCDSSYSMKPACCRCNCQPAPAYQGDCSDASSQEEEPYVQGHKKKLGSKSPCQPAKNSPSNVRRGPHAADLNGPAERRKKSGAARSGQDGEQHLMADKRLHVAAKSKRVPPTDREKAKAKSKGAAFIPNGSLVPALCARRKDGGSGPDTFGETSSESYSSPSSPQHRESLDSEDDNNKDTDSHSDDCSKGAPVFFSHHGDAPLHPVQMEALCPEAGVEMPPLSFLHPPPYAMPNGVSDPPALPQTMAPDGKPSGALVMQMPLAPAAMPGPGLVGDPEKREVLPTFGIPPLGLHPAGSPGVLVQRFKTSQGSGEVPPHQAPIRPLSMGAPMLPCPDPAAAASPLPHVDPPHAKHPGLPLPSGLPSPYTLPPASAVPGPAGAAQSTQGHIQAAVPPAVPTHTPGPAPSPSPALTHSTAHSDSTSYSNSSASGGSAASAAPQQQSTPAPQQSCRICGCHNNCGGRGSASGATSCQTPLFFPAHQMAAARQVFSVPPPLFQLTSLGSSSYLTPAHAPHQANGAATLSPFFPTAPPPYLHSHADVSSHMLGTQAAAVAAACYSLQQQMAPAANFCQRVYQHVYPNPLGMLTTAALSSGGVNKKNGNVSCYNCGVSGHYAQDCNQPSIDSTQQGGFRLKYATSHVSEALDNGD